MSVIDESFNEEKDDTTRFNLLELMTEGNDIEEEHPIVKPNMANTFLTMDRQIN